MSVTPKQVLYSSNLVVGTPLFTMIRRSLAVFLFWFCIVYAMGMVYNEVVVSETLKGFTAVEPAPLEEGEEGLPDPKYERFRLEHHQMIGYSFAAGVVAVVARMVAEAICYFYGRETCAMVTGQAIVVKKSGDLVEDDKEFSREERHSSRRRREERSEESS